MLSERSNVSKMEIDDIVKDQYSKLMLDHILAQGSKLSIDGVSILPPQQELDKYENDYDKFIFLSHYVHHKFNELASSDKKKYSVLQELLDGLNINYNEINQRKHRQMERHYHGLGLKNQYCQNDYTAEGNLQIQFNLQI